MTMSTRIIAALVASAVLATAVASPALAQSAPSGAQHAQQNNGGTFHGRPLSEWYRPDSW
jgi:hypothetical protein